MSNSPVMRAKLQVGFVQVHENRLNAEGRYDPNAVPIKSMETLTLHAVAKNGYDSTGDDEDNTFAKWSPGATMSINIANPALWGKFAVGDKFYVDFTAVPKT